MRLGLWGVFVLLAVGCGGPAPGPAKALLPAPSVESVTPNSGGAGIAVVIAGTNFQEGATVSFGGVSADDVTFTSAVSLSAVTPSGVVPQGRVIAFGKSFKVDVSVSNPDGQTADLASGFTYPPSCGLCGIRAPPPPAAQ